MFEEEGGQIVAKGPIAKFIPEAAQAVTQITTAYATVQEQTDDAALRESLAAYLTAAIDPRRERYSELLSIINCWDPPNYPSKELHWFLTAMAQTEH